MCGIAGVFAFFQALMPMIGWTCVHTMLRYFTMFEKYIPWIASVLLFAICLAGLKICRQFGTKYSDKAAILGGLVLIAIGLEILTAEIL